MTVDEAYQSKECEALFAAVNEMIPDLDNGLDDAADYVFDQLLIQLPGEHWDDDKFKADLYEMIVAGLT